MKEEVTITKDAFKDLRLEVKVKPVDGVETFKADVEMLMDQFLNDNCKKIAIVYDNYIESEHQNCDDKCTKKWEEQATRKNFIRDILEIFEELPRIFNSPFDK